MSVRVDLWSDIVCPWCLIGKAHLDKAIEMSGINVEIHWRAFQLDPNATRECTGNIVTVLAQKYGASELDARRMIASVSERAEQVGVHLNLDSQLPTSTFDAQRLIQWAQSVSLEDREPASRLAVALAQAALRDGLCVSDQQVLEQVAIGAGCDPVGVRGLLESDDFADAVLADQEMAREMGATGVPYFVFDGKVALSGAQPTEVMVQVLTSVSNGPG